MNAWVSGARPRTLGAGIVPVLVGTAAADRFLAWRFVAALLVAIGLQVGVNYLNDYFDGVRGVDTPERVGPPRLVATGVASPVSVLVAALVSIGVAGFAGLALALATEPVLILFVGALAGKHLARLTLEGEKVVGEERLLVDRARVRDVRVGPDGAVYVLTDESDGELLKLVPRP